MMEWLQEHREVVSLFVKIFNEYTTLYSRAREYGNGIEISLSEVQVLEKIIEKQQLNMSDLAGALGYSSAAVTKSVKKLETKGLIDKYKKPENQKEVLVRLTDLGDDTYGLYQSYVYEKLFKDIFRFFDESPEGTEQSVVTMLNMIQSFFDEFRNK